MLYLKYNNIDQFCWLTKLADFCMTHDARPIFVVDFIGGQNMRSLLIIRHPFRLDVHLL